VTAAHSITFDNLGEVTELARGEFPAGEPLGQHYSVTRALPRILAALEETGLRATFFVEGRNTELYPDTLAAIAAAGHEVAYHGWCHEAWGGLEPGEEAELLERGVRALDELGLRPVGFRPPGGELNPATMGLLRRLGFTYASPARGGAPPRDDSRGAAPRRDESSPADVAILPFAWPAVDAYHYLPRFAGLRGSDEPHSPAEFARVLGAHPIVVFHAFLAEPEERFAVIRAHLHAVRERVDRGELACEPCRDVAARLTSGPCSR
jgi:hypothetical protein